MTEEQKTKFEQYKKLPKWKGKIFMQDEKTCFLDGYHECQKEHEWHNINDVKPSKEQFGKQLLLRLESLIGDTDYDYLVYEYKGEDISDVAGVIDWKEIE